MLVIQDTQLETLDDAAEVRFRLELQALLTELQPAIAESFETSYTPLDEDILGEDPPKPVAADGATPGGMAVFVRDVLVMADLMEIEEPDEQAVFATLMLANERWGEDRPRVFAYAQEAINREKSPARVRLALIRARLEALVAEQEDAISAEILGQIDMAAERMA